MDTLPSIAKKKNFGTKCKNHLLSSSPKSKSTETTGSVFAEKNEIVNKTEFELKVLKFVDCF